MHGFPVIVFDRNNKIHLPLTVFAKEAHAATSHGTANTYLNTILPFFSWLEIDQWQIRSGVTWNDKPERVRQAIYEYLIQKMCCKVRHHKYGFQVVDVTADSRSTTRFFLSALKLFYGVMVNKKHYPFENNPLVDAFSLHAIESLSNSGLPNGDFPRMPSISGTEEPRKRRRLSDSYFRLSTPI
ncbi:hypothetical protein [Brevibacillus centrosporus]|uniref:hypothetical protein n=1 Tax=Brevibacillus centrosporus TaxID=54910 RepID=UPI003B02E911